MKKGFTVLELLVASLLLGILVTVMTMVINQSAVVWRVGIAGVEQMDEARDNVAALRHEADKVYIWNDQAHALLSPWTKDGTLRTRAIDAGDTVEAEEYEKVPYLLAEGKLKDGMAISDIPYINVGSSRAAGFKNYVINVISIGPDREIGTWDDIQSFPDDYEL